MMEKLEDNYILKASFIILVTFKTTCILINNILIMVKTAVIKRCYILIALVLGSVFSLHEKITPVPKQ